jgi:hypothetical protein
VVLGFGSMCFLILGLAATDDPQRTYGGAGGGRAFNPSDSTSILD